MPREIEHKFLTANRLRNQRLRKLTYNQRMNNKPLKALGKQLFKHANSVSKKYRTVNVQHFHHLRNAKNAVLREKARLKNLAEIERVVRATQRERGNNRNAAKIILHSIKALKTKALNNYGNNLRRMYKH